MALPLSYGANSLFPINGGQGRPPYCQAGNFTLP